MVLPLIPPAVLELLKDTAIWVGPVIGKAIAGKYAKDAVEAVNAKLGKVWERLRGVNPKAAKALQALEADQNLDALSDLQTYLRDAMEDDPELQKLVAELAQELETAKKNAVSGVHQEISGENAKGTLNYNPNNQGKIYQADSITIHEASD